MSGDKGAIAKAEDFESEDTALLISAPTIFELYVGISLSGRPEEEKAKILAVLESLPFLPLDYLSSQAGGSIYGVKQLKGHPIDPEDAMIAGIARVHGKKILTRNLRHFQGIEGVTVEPY